MHTTMLQLPQDIALERIQTESKEAKEKVEIEDDVLDLIRDLPHEINDASTTTEMKFLTVGSVLWACHEEIKKLRAEVEGLKSGKSHKRKAMSGMQAAVRRP